MTFLQCLSPFSEIFFLDFAFSVSCNLSRSPTDRSSFSTRWNLFSNRTCLRGPLSVPRLLSTCSQSKHVLGRIRFLQSARCHVDSAIVRLHDTRKYVSHVLAFKQRPSCRNSIARNAAEPTRIPPCLFEEPRMRQLEN